MRQYCVYGNLVLDSHPVMDAVAMTVDVTAVFAAYFARNQGPDPSSPDKRQSPDYGVSAIVEDGVVKLALTFRRGFTYCCYEYGCHLNLHSGNRWEWLRRELSALNLDLPPRLQLYLEVVIEDGAFSFDWSKPDPVRRGWYAFVPARADCYQVSIQEAPHSV